MAEVRQSGMGGSPAIEEAEWQMFYPLRGYIEGVSFADQTPIRRTVVNVVLLDRSGQRQDRRLFNVPLLYPKLSGNDGEEWTPSLGDMVLVGFINANLKDPVILGHLAPPNNAIQAKLGEAPRYHRRRNGTDEKIEKDGTRRVFIAKDDILEVVGEGTVTIGKGLTVYVGEGATIQAGGDADIQIAGAANITAEGKATVIGKGTIDLIGSDGGAVKGCVQGDGICAYTGGPHPHVSDTVKATP